MGGNLSSSRGKCFIVFVSFLFCKKKLQNFKRKAESQRSQEPFEKKKLRAWCRGTNHWSRDASSRWCPIKGTQRSLSHPFQNSYFLSKHSLSLLKLSLCSPTPQTPFYTHLNTFNHTFCFKFTLFVVIIFFNSPLLSSTLSNQGMSFFFLFFFE